MPGFGLEPRGPAALPVPVQLLQPGGGELARDLVGLSRQRIVPLGQLCLLLERLQLATDLTDQVLQPQEILFVADAYQAMTCDRPYQPALSPREALAEPRRCAGTQFDPAIVAVLEAEVGLAARRVDALAS